MGLLKKFLQKVHIIEDDSPEPVKDPKARRKGDSEDSGKKAPVKESKSPVAEAPVRDKPPQQPPKQAPKAKVITLDDLKQKAKKLKLGLFDELIKPGEELKLSFEEVFSRGNVQDPPHGWTIMKILDRLSTEEFKRMGDEQIKALFLGELKADKSSPREVLQDALSRDEILDDYEKFLQERVTKTKETLLDENADIEQKLRDLTAKKEQNTRRIEDEARALERWKSGKLELEKNIARAASYLTVENIVSIGLVTDPSYREPRMPGRAALREEAPAKQAPPPAPAPPPHKQPDAPVKREAEAQEADAPQLIDLPGEEFKF